MHIYKGVQITRSEEYIVLENCDPDPDGDDCGTGAGGCTDDGTEEVEEM
ncbi:MAG: hypothetical protein Q8P99_02270 [bacterium]|nr:hypothetical protein [bacterium]